MYFTKKQQKILCKAYKRKEFTVKLLDKVANENLDDLREKLNLIGYTLIIKIIG